MNAVVLAIFAGLFWGVGELCTKWVLHTKQVGPITAVTVRSVVALPAILMAYIVAVHVLKLRQEPATWYRADARTLWTLVIGSGLCAGAAALICFYAALNLGEISRIKPIAFTIAPATAVLLGYLLLGEAMSARRWIAVAMILGGVLLLTSAPKPATAPADLNSTAETHDAASR
ncbi:MAG: EamA family transporter [Phycisphaerales bacterium]